MSIEAVKINNALVDHSSVYSAGNGAAAKTSAGQNAETPVKEADPAAKKEISSEKIQKAVNVANDFLKMADTGLEYEYNQEIQREVVKIYNRDTGEVIKQIPAEDVVHMLTKMYDMLGVLYDKKF